MPDEFSPVPDNPLGFPVYRLYDCFDWYWLADDGRLWSSKKRALVPTTDPDYVAWSNGALPTVWPRDDQGAQTDAALQTVFDSYNITIGGVPMAQLDAKHSQKLIVKSGK